MAVSQAIIDQTDVLTDADLAIGDGDHGIGMRRGFEAAMETLNGITSRRVSMWRSRPPAWPSCRIPAARQARFSARCFAPVPRRWLTVKIDAAASAGFLEEGLAAVLKRGGVVEGQKTMVDALAPAARAARGAASGGLKKATAAAADGALQGVEASKGMIATTGKARSLGERSIGHPDPGAISISLILIAMRDFCAKG